MNEPEFNAAPIAQPRTTTVITLLTIAAVTFSYLIAYAMTSALLKAEILKPWPHDHDPRPKWFAMIFLILTGIFLTIGLIARFATRRQLNQIDPE
jgi:H+/Cl- antiporter ClcA